MAKNITFRMGQHSFAAAINKVDRDKVYGFVEEVITDESGKSCVSGSLLDDGQTVVLSGATALKTVDANQAEVDKKALKMVYADGTDAVLVASSYDGEVELKQATQEELFDLEVNTVYQLQWEDDAAKQSTLKQLDNGALWKFVFNYRADYEGADAIMLSAQNEVFVLTGRLLEFDFLENKTAVPVAEPEVEQEEDSMDFGML